MHSRASPALHRVWQGRRTGAVRAPARVCFKGGLSNHLAAGNMHMPSPGNTWHCLERDDEFWLKRRKEAPGQPFKSHITTRDL